MINYMDKESLGEFIERTGGPLQEHHPNCSSLHSLVDCDCGAVTLVVELDKEGIPIAISAEHISNMDERESDMNKVWEEPINGVE